jgi:hypothetical protein
VVTPIYRFSTDFGEGLLAEDEPVVLFVGEGDDGEAELAEHDGALEDGGFADLGQGLFALEALAGLEADDGGGHFGRGDGRSQFDGDHFGGADRGFAFIGVVDDAHLALFHVAEGDEGLGVLDAVPDGLAVAEEVVVGVLVGFGFEEVGHRAVNRE